MYFIQFGKKIRYFSKKIKNGDSILRYTGAVIAGIGLHIILIIIGVQDNIVLLYTL